jgi:SAM-dependent methyltransferase
VAGATSEQAHWEGVYESQGVTALSWHEEAPTGSLRMIEAAGLANDAAILDVGGGASRLASGLAELGYEDITVADLSAQALSQLPGEQEAIRRVVADVRSHDFGRQFDLWHDRAAFHFMVKREDQVAYLSTLTRTLRSPGHVVIATFGPDGPERCSGLPVKRYGADELEASLGASFSMVSTKVVEHTTPSGSLQQFLYAHLRRD